MLISILVAMCAVFSYINIRFLKLQPSIGLMLMSLICSLLIIAESKISSAFYHHVEYMVRSIDFSQTLLNIMLGFLLFAGALHVNLNE
jgi:monovalent cation:H+ antiporter, CPA1 family